MGAGTKMTVQALPAVADGGIILTDLTFVPVAMDQGAITMLCDVVGSDVTEEATASGPLLIKEAVDGAGFGSISPLTIQLKGTRYAYNCCVYRIQWRQSDSPESMIAIHLHKLISTDDAIEQIAATCNLTERETGVLRGISLGLTSKEIATQMSISPNTVKSYIRLLMVKTGVATRSGIVGKLVDQLVRHQS